MQSQTALNVVNSSNMKVHVFRLLPEEDLYQEILKYLNDNNIKAACILSCVGSLKEINIRTATGKNYISKKQCFEILSLVGCISIDRCHLHISLGDENGQMLGGHLMRENNLVYTTAEVVIGELLDLAFSEEHCQKSGWPELKIQKKE